MTYKAFFATDIHGSDVCFRKFLNAAAAYSARVLILGGDICAKMIVPILEQAGTWRADVFGTYHECHTSREVDELATTVRRSGAYSYRTTVDEWSAITADSEAEGRLFGCLAAELIADWVSLAEQRLRGTGVRCLIGAGNDDPWAIDDVLESSDFVEVPDWHALDLDGFTLYTVGEATTTPWNSPRELTEDTYAGKLAKYVGNGDADFERTIFNLHVPPYLSGLDNAPEINEKFEVQYAAGEPIMKPVGSTAVRAAIEKYQPLLGLHGHVHESPGAVRIGRTLCINPGSDYGANLLRGALVTLDHRKGIKGYQLTVG